MSRDELQELRARAYGPSADIDQDAAALRRLHELENLSRERADAEAGAAAAEPPPSAPIVVRVAAPVEEPSSTRPAVTAVTASPAESEPAITAAAELVPPKTRRLSWGVKILWGLSVAASAAAAAAITFGLTYIAPVSVSSGAEQIATLEPSPSKELPVGWMGAGPSSRAYEFHGLTLFETPYGYTTTGSDCFTIVTTDEIPAADVESESWTWDGAVYSGCRVGDFPAEVAIPVDSNTPEELRARFPEDSALQFVLDGERIGVFLDTP